MNTRFFTALMLAALAGPTLPALASDMDIQAGIQTRAAISLDKTADIDFGTLEYDATHSGRVRLGTDGAIVIEGGTGLTAQGSPSAAEIHIAGDSLSVIEISCETSATLSDGNGNNLALDSAEFTVDAGVAAGAGTSCAGLGTAAGTLDLFATPVPVLRMGASIDTGSTPISTSAFYSTTASGGDPLTLRVVYQ